MNKVEICGVNTATLPVLNKEEKDELLIKIKKGDLEAREKFINGNLRLVLSVRVSRSIRDLAYKALQVKEKLTKDTEKEPTIEQIAKVLEVEKEEVALSLDAIQDPISLQEPIYKDDSENLYIMDQIRDNKNIDEKWAENLTIAQALKKLNQREKDIIARRFFDGRTQMEVAEEIGISQAQVSRLEKDAINRIRKLYN